MAVLLASYQVSILHRILLCVSRKLILALWFGFWIEPVWANDQSAQKTLFTSKVAKRDPKIIILILLSRLILISWLHLVGMFHKDKPLKEVYSNQDRIPTPTEGETLPAPYPMKLAPADKRDEAPDKQNIRYLKRKIFSINW